MIDAKELRIGNVIAAFVDGEELIGTIITLGNQEVSTRDHAAAIVRTNMGEKYVDYKNLRSLPLTEKNLKALGFKNYNQIVFSYYSEHREIYAKKHNDASYEVFLDQSLSKGTFIRTVCYLHMMQNIVFYFIGSELGVDVSEVEGWDIVMKKDL